MCDRIYKSKLGFPSHSPYATQRNAASDSPQTQGSDFGVRPSFGFRISEFGFTSPRAFTLIELLVVIAVIGLLSYAAMPVLKNITKADSITAAYRQLINDIAYARRLAMTTRSTVYMVFMNNSNNIMDSTVYTGVNKTAELDFLAGIAGAQFNGYTFYSERRVGDQPGQKVPNYLGGWKTLPQGIAIAPWKFYGGANAYVHDGFGFTNINVMEFDYRPLPFPLPQSFNRSMPYIAFNYQGQLVYYDNSSRQEEVSKLDAVIPLARGKIFFSSSTNGLYLVQPARFTEDPAGNSLNSNMWHFVRVNWLTGKAKLNRRELNP